jgi:aminoglycoside 6'-N-acetyltransferase I
MLIQVSNEYEKAWAELCVALWQDDSLDDWIQEGREKSFEGEYLYLINGEAVAFLSLSLRHDYVEGTDSSPVGYLEAIYVKPDYRNQGIAKELVAFAKKWSIEKGCTELASDCELHNDNSRKFHNKIGFEEANTIVCFTMDLCPDKQ